MPEEEKNMKKSSALLTLAIVVTIVVVCVILFYRWQEQLTKDYITSTHHLMGLRFASGKIGGKSNIDSAIFYYRKAVNAGGSDDVRNKAMITLIEALCEKARQSRETDLAQSCRDSAAIVLTELERRNIEEGRLFVLKRLVYDNDTKWYYDEKEKKSYRLTD